MLEDNLKFCVVVHESLKLLREHDVPLGLQLSLHERAPWIQLPRGLENQVIKDNNL